MTETVKRADEGGAIRAGLPGGMRCFAAILYLSRGLGAPPLFCYDSPNKGAPVEVKELLEEI